MVHLCRRSSTLSLFLFVFRRQIYSFTHLASAALGTSNVPRVWSPEGDAAHGRQTRRPLDAPVCSFISQTMARKTADLKAHGHLQIEKPCISFHLKNVIRFYRSMRSKAVWVSVQEDRIRCRRDSAAPRFYSWTSEQKVSSSFQPLHKTYLAQIWVIFSFVWCSFVCVFFFWEWVHVHVLS